MAWRILHFGIGIEDFQNPGKSGNYFDLTPFKEKIRWFTYIIITRQLKIIEYIQKIGYLQNQAFESLFPMVSGDTKF